MPGSTVGEDAILNVEFGPDLVKLVREGQTRGLFADRAIVSFLTGEPEYLDPLKDEAPEGWIVTGYPWEQINTPEHSAFRDAYRRRFNDYPRLGSVVGYDTVMAIAALLRKAPALETEAKLAAHGVTIPAAVEPAPVTSSIPVFTLDSVPVSPVHR